MKCKRHSEESSVARTTDKKHSRSMQNNTKFISSQGTSLNLHWKDSGDSGGIRTSFHSPKAWLHPWSVLFWAPQVYTAEEPACKHSAPGRSQPSASHSSLHCKGCLVKEIKKGYFRPTTAGQWDHVHGGLSLKVGLNDLGSVFQMKQFNHSTIIELRKIFFSNEGNTEDRERTEQKQP